MISVVILICVLYDRRLRVLVLLAVVVTDVHSDNVNVGDGCTVVVTICMYRNV